MKEDCQLEKEKIHPMIHLFTVRLFNYKIKEVLGHNYHKLQKFSTTKCTAFIATNIIFFT
jgi:hypothetical protein